MTSNLLLLPKCCYHGLWRCYGENTICKSYVALQKSAPQLLPLLFALGYLTIYFISVQEPTSFGWVDIISYHIIIGDMRHQYQWSSDRKHLPIRYPAHEAFSKFTIFVEFCSTLPPSLKDDGNNLSLPIGSLLEAENKRTNKV